MAVVEAEAASTMRPEAVQPAKVAMAFVLYNT